MLIDIKDYIPKYLSRIEDDRKIALIEKVNYLNTELFNSIRKLTHLTNPMKCPFEFLGELGHLLNAGILRVDSDYTKRKKIITAIQGHKKRGSWENDVKNKIDGITGYSSSLYSTEEDLVFPGKAGLQLSNWFTLGGIDTTTNFGFSLVGTGKDLSVAGIIGINCHIGIYTGILTQETVNKLVLELKEDIVPAYFRVLLGYLNNDGYFIIYDGGTIG